MKRFAYFTFSAVTVILLSLILGCKDSKNKIKKETSNPFAGTWIAKDFINNIITNNGIKKNRLISGFLLYQVLEKIICLAK